MTTYVATWGNPSKDVTTSIEFEALSDEHARHKAAEFAVKYHIPERLREIRRKGAPHIRNVPLRTRRTESKSSAARTTQVSG